jgi:hypothetical protein
MTFLQRSARETGPTPQWRFSDANRPEPTRTDKTYAKHKIDYVDQFHALVRRWRLETSFSSSVTKKLKNGSFERIIQMGPPVIGLIVGELRKKRDFLFMALPFLVPDEDIVPEKAKGNPHEMIEAWLNWADRNKIDAS